MSAERGFSEVIRPLVFGAAAAIGTVSFMGVLGEQSVDQVRFASEAPEEAFKYQPYETATTLPQGGTEQSFDGPVMVTAPEFIEFDREEDFLLDEADIQSIRTQVKEVFDLNDPSLGTGRLTLQIEASASAEDEQDGV
jgi:hypothetical protein